MGKRIAGPLDGRRKASRCFACAGRHIKCEGGHPCTHCSRRKQACVPQNRDSNPMVTFVSQEQQGEIRRQSDGSQTEARATALKSLVGLPEGSPRTSGSLFLDCFVVFMQTMATFTKEFPSVRSDLLVLMTTSPILDNAIRAIGALTASRQGAVSIRGRVLHPRVAAIQCYQRAISALRVALLDRGLVRGDDVLWATFLLGVFELHSDCSGEGYVSHVFHGTSALLQLTGPSSSMTPLRRAFYDIFRVVEASRALPHCESTILTEPTWLRFQQMQQESRDYWDPLDEISTLMIDASTFILRARETTSRIFAANRDTNPSVLSLAMEGLKIQQTIYHWHDQTLAHRSQGHPSTNIDLALLEYHALLLFILSDSRAFPNCIYPPGPRLTPAETRDHVTAILDLCARILQLRSAPGILLCFPLLIAGSQIPVQDQRARVLCLVHRVLCSGFGSAKRVRETLMQCWSVCDAEEHVRQRCVAGV